jgi:hypothetical protein
MRNKCDYQFVISFWHKFYHIISVWIILWYMFYTIFKRYNLVVLPTRQILAYKHHVHNLRKQQLIMWNAMFHQLSKYVTAWLKNSIEEFYKTALSIPSHNKYLVQILKNVFLYLKMDNWWSAYNIYFWLDGCDITFITLLEFFNHQHEFLTQSSPHYLTQFFKNQQTIFLTKTLQLS